MPAACASSRNHQPDWGLQLGLNKQQLCLDNVMSPQNNQKVRSFTVSFKSRACVAMSHLGLKKARSGTKFEPAHFTARPFDTQVRLHYFQGQTLLTREGPFHVLLCSLQKDEHVLCTGSEIHSPGLLKALISPSYPALFPFHLSCPTQAFL